MYIYKKKFISALSLSVFVFSCFAEQQVGLIVEDHSTGLAKINSILSQSFKEPYGSQGEYVKVLPTLARDFDLDRVADFFNCKTKVGHKFLVEALQKPLINSNPDSLIMQRQRTIRALVENRELRQQVEAVLIKAQEEEGNVITLFSDFFVGKTCPELKQLENSKAQMPKLIYSCFEAMFKNPIPRALNLFSQLLTLGGMVYGEYSLATLLRDHLKARGASFFTVAKADPSTLIVPATMTFYALPICLLSYQVAKDYKQAQEKREKIHALYQFASCAERIETICKNYGLKHEFKISSIESAEGKQLLNTLKKSRYTTRSTKLFFPPFVHTFLYDIFQKESHLSMLFASIAELDAYHAIASKIVEHQERENTFCFVSFSDAIKPTVAATGFWNVLVTDPVVNSISENVNIILTGPNAGGKTTSIRAVLQNIIFGQTFGFAAAQQCECSLFDVVHSYLHISDDLHAGLSLFASEVKRAQNILEEIATLEQGQKFFFALDELFTGTHYEDGQLCANNFINKITQFSGVQFIYATHFEKLKELGKHNSACQNYKVDAPAKNEDGKLQYPYTLSKGASEARVALDIAREAGLFA